MGTADFTTLITSEHINAPKFVATVAGVCESFSDSLDFLANVPALYNVDTAIGAQLDVVGLWVGASRLVAISVDQYFSFDEEGLGFDQGIWWQVGDSLTTATQLTDDIYRSLIKAKILCNSWDGAVPGFVAIVQELIGTDSVITVTENTMAVTVTVKSTTISNILKAILENDYLPLTPAGVSISWNFSQ